MSKPVFLNYAFYLSRFVFLVLCSSVVLLLTEGKKHPIITPYVAFTPYKKLAITRKTAYIVQHTDTTEYITHLQTLNYLHETVNKKIAVMNLTKDDLPAYRVLSKQAHDSIERSAVTLMDALQSLSHEDHCLPQAKRSKREVDLVRQQGLFPGIGRALGWLTGTLTSDAASYINKNFHNINKLKNSQLHMIKVINNTAIVGKKNSDQIYSLKMQLAKMGNDLQQQISKGQAVNYAITTVQQLLSSAQAFHDRVDDLVYGWQFSSTGTLGQKTLNQQLWSFIWEALDAPTKAYKDIRHIVKHASQISLEACHVHTFLHINVPLLSPVKHTAYKTNVFPVFHDTHYVILDSYAHLVMWDEEKSYEYTEKEVNTCKELKHLMICNPPQNIQSLKDSCMFSLAKNLSKKCKVVPTTKVENKFMFKDSYLTYFIKRNDSQLITEVCPGTHARTTEIKDAGTIKLPHKCKLLINGLVYENKLSHTYHTLNKTPTFFEPNFQFKIPTPRMYTTPSSDASEADTIFDENQANLEVASDILGNFEITPDQVIIMSISFTSILILATIAIIVLYCIVCGPMAGCITFPRTRNSRPRVHRNSLTDP